MSTFSAQNFKIGPCTVIFKDEVLGETRNSSTIEFKSEYDTFTNDQMTGIPIIRHLKTISIIFETEIMAIDKGMGMLLDSNRRITMEEINWMREPEYGELKLIPVNPLDTVGYRFPRALLLRNSKLTLDSKKEYKIKLKFEAVYDENELMLEEISVSSSDRVNLNITDSIEPAAFERAMTYYIADKLDMTVDTDIFRGKLPPGVEGCAVALEHEKEQNDIMDRHYEFSVIFVDSSRDEVMKAVHDLGDEFPVYGQDLNLDGIGTVSVKSIYKSQSSYDSLFADDGKIKAIGKLSLIAVL